MRWITIENDVVYIHILTRNGKYVKFDAGWLIKLLKKFLDEGICHNICYPYLEDLFRGYAKKENYGSEYCRSLAQDCIDKIYRYILNET